MAFICSVVKDLYHIYLRSAQYQLSLLPYLSTHGEVSICRNSAPALLLLNSSSGERALAGYYRNTVLHDPKFYTNPNHISLARASSITSIDHHSFIVSSISCESQLPNAGLLPLPHSCWSHLLILSTSSRSSASELSSSPRFAQSWLPRFWLL